MYYTLGKTHKYLKDGVSGRKGTAVAASNDTDWTLVFGFGISNGWTPRPLC